jgi:GT2 family glycosyltransferase
MKEMTIIIPTMSGREEVLAQMLRGLEEQDAGLDAFDVIVVQDGGGAAPGPDSPLHRSTRVFRHDLRRGLSAVRNTGLAQVRTPLAMFIDDDIIPSPGVLRAHLAFHARHHDPLVMGAGRVTWRGHPKYNGMMEWLETVGDWSLFHRLAPDQCFPYWIGGYTSFFAETLRDLAFDETFTLYGCEDHELGYRFFRQGGRLRFVDQAEGLHLKWVTAGSTYREGRSGGYNKWLLSARYPDVTGTPMGLITAIQMERQVPDHQPVLDMLDRFATGVHNQLKRSTGLLFQFVSGLANGHGQLDYWREAFPGFDDAAEHLYHGYVTGGEDLGEALAAALSACPTMPWIGLHAARHTQDLTLRKERLRRILARYPAYSLVQLELLECLDDPVEAEQSIDHFASEQLAGLERSGAQTFTYKAAMILLRLGRAARAEVLLNQAADFECWEEGQLIIARRALKELGALHAGRGDAARAAACVERQHQMPAGSVQALKDRASLCGPHESILKSCSNEWLTTMGEL